MESIAIIDSTNRVINIIQCNYQSDWECPEGFYAIKEGLTEHCVIGAYYSDGKFSLPAEEVDPEAVTIEAAELKANLLAECTIIIDTLLDAVDMEMASEAEKELLFEWKKYRVLLNRADISNAPHISWPERPAG